VHKERSVPINAVTESQSLRDRISWSLFILERYTTLSNAKTTRTDMISQLSLSQFRDDPRSIESAVKQPSAEIKKQFPVFCHRLALARITHKFCKMGMDGCASATTFANMVDQLHTSMSNWKEALPVRTRFLILI
jgi:hypothetical protein